MIRKVLWLLAGLVVGSATTVAVIAVSRELENSNKDDDLYRDESTWGYC